MTLLSKKIKEKTIFLTFCCAILSGCAQKMNQTVEERYLLVELTPEVIISPQSTIGIHEGSQAIIPESKIKQTSTSTPTPLPIIKEVSECEVESNGHILFLSNEYNKNLYVMDGNGCNVYHILEGVSGSPDWTVDGLRVAVGCENNRMICILDMIKTLDSCKEEGEGKTCDAILKQKIPLPEEVGEKRIYNLSWSHDGQKLLVEFAILPEATNTYLLYLTDDPYWELLIEGLGNKADFSPIEDRIMVADMPMSLFEINLDKGMIIDNYTPGDNPQWSSDGKYLAFLCYYLSNNFSNIEPTAILSMKVDFDSKMDEERWVTLYSPRHYDPENWQRRNVIFSDNDYRILSWSPNSRYIAFVGDYRYEGDSQIFRLDIETGEIFVLTTKLDSVYGEMQYIAPAWGP